MYLCLLLLSMEVQDDSVYCGHGLHNFFVGVVWIVFLVGGVVYRRS